MPPTKLVTCGICQEVFDNDLKFTDHFLSIHTSNNDSEDSSSDSEDEQLHSSTSKKEVANPVLLTKKIIENPNSKLPTSDDSSEDSSSSDSEDDQLLSSNSKKDILNPILESAVVEITSSKFPDNTCHVCGDVKSNQRRLAYHILTHLGAMPYFCSPCGFSCISKLRFQQHIYNHGVYKSYKQRYWLFTKSNMHECEVCNIGFSVWTELVLHYATHIYSMPFNCNECQLYFEDVKDYTIHTHIHKYTTRCELCNIFFDSRPRLLDHVLEHNKSKQFRKFRHIPWNDGLSPIQNPFSVLRADVYGNSFKQVKWYPESNLSDSSDKVFLYDTVRDFCKCDVKEELIVYEDRADVGHLCEVLFEVKDTDYKIGDYYIKPKEDLTPEEKDKISSIFEKSVKVDKCENKSPKGDLPKKKIKLAVLSQKGKASKDEAGSLDDAVQENVEILNSAPESSLPDDSSDSKESKLESECSKSEIRPVELKLKKLRVVLQKLSDEVCDWKSFRRYNDRLRRKRMKLKWAKIKELQNNPVPPLKEVDSSSCLVTRSGRVLVKVTETSESRKESLESNIKDTDKKKVVEDKSLTTSGDAIVSKNKKKLNSVTAPLTVNEVSNGENNGKMNSQNSAILSPHSIVNKRNLRSQNNSATHKTKKKCNCCTDSDVTLPTNDHSAKHKGVHSSSELHCKLKTSFHNILNSNKANNNHILNHSSSNQSSKSASNLTSNKTKRVDSNRFHISTQRLGEMPTFCSTIRHDHDYFTNSLNLIKNVKYKYFSKNMKDYTKKTKLPFTEKLKKMKEFKSVHSTKSQKKLSPFCDRKKNVHCKTTISSKVEVLKAKIVRVNLIRLPLEIYEKHLKRKPIMLDNILPLISKVESMQPKQNLSSQFLSSYSNPLIIFEEHNYCKSLDEESDSDSTLTSYSDSIMDFL